MTMHASRWKGLVLTHRSPKISGLEMTLTVTEYNFPVIGEIHNKGLFMAHSASLLPSLCVALSKALTSLVLSFPI